MLKLDLSKATNHELAILAHFGDEEGSSHLWERLTTLAGKIAMTFVKRYPWVAFDDLNQSILLTYPKIISRFDPSKAKFEKFVAISFYRAAQDELRRQDPLGIGIPQKSHYPAYTQISNVESRLCKRDNPQMLDEIINAGVERIRKGYKCSRK
jgi:DNA-directed RNA polymerase specialized sigma subunit